MVDYAYFYPLTMAWIWISGGLYYFWQRERGKPLYHDTPQITGPWPKATFVAPCHNEEANVRETIAALAGQDYPDFEIIAVNDGSTDDTGAILDQLTTVHPMLRVLHLKQNQGKAIGLRMAAIAASGDFLVCVDGDAMLDRHASRWLIHPMIINPRVGAVTGNPRIRNRSTILGKLQVGEFSSVIGLVKRAQMMHGCLFTVSGVVAAFRRTALHHVEYWGNDMVTEDIDISWRLQKNDWQIRYEPNAICWILMPETLSGLWSQRLRWAQGGMEVVLRHMSELVHWNKKRMWPLLTEFFLSALWSYVVAALILMWIFDFFLSLSREVTLPSLVPGWYGVVLAATCLTQFTLSLVIESRYEKKVGGHLLWMVWYPIVYWTLGMLTTVVGIVVALNKSRGKRAVWESPDRGI